jgi:uncharacterized phage protein (TIGR01671 family)
MREIKFRTWYRRPKDCVGAGEMYMSFPITIKDLINAREGYEFRKVGLWGYDEHLELAPETILMQYTGLKDSKGKEIYEWDICRSDGIEAPIKYLLGAFWFGAVLLLEPKEIEIIGNIYENPELLKKE